MSIGLSASLDIWITDETSDNVVIILHEEEYNPKYKNFYKSTYNSVVCEIKDLESGVNPDIEVINDRIKTNWKKLSFLNRWKYH